jgi:hypothetical protein
VGGGCSLGSYQAGTTALTVTATIASLALVLAVRYSHIFRSFFVNSFECKLLG